MANDDPRFGDKAASADELKPGAVAWQYGTTPVLVVSVTKAEQGDDAAVQVAALDVTTVHVDDLATEYVEPGSEPGPAGPPAVVGAPPAPATAAQPAADDASRQTAPTGAEATAGTATPDAAGAQPGGQDPRVDPAAKQG